MSEKVLSLRRADSCADCGAALAIGERARWDRESRTVTCFECMRGTDPEELTDQGEMLSSVPTAGTGGASAQREFERRHDARRDRVMTRHPKIGGLLLALVDDAPSTKVWAQGAAGERAVAERLDRLENGLVLHDRRLRRPDGRLSQGNIDHIAIVPSGVWVIDAKTHKGRLEVRRSGGLFSPRVAQLRINERDQTKLVVGVQRQMEAVRVALYDVAPTTAVFGALCFYGTEMPLMIDEEIDGVALGGRRGLMKLLRRPGPLGSQQIADLHNRLAELFPIHQ